jgi:hypothetical protein
VLVENLLDSCLTSSRPSVRLWLDFVSVAAMVRAWISCCAYPKDLLLLGRNPVLASSVNRTPGPCRESNRSTICRARQLTTPELLASFRAPLLNEGREPISPRFWPLFFSRCGAGVGHVGTLLNRFKGFGLSPVDVLNIVGIGLMLAVTLLNSNSTAQQPIPAAQQESPDVPREALTTCAHHTRFFNICWETGTDNQY